MAPSGEQRIGVVVDHHAGLAPEHRRSARLSAASSAVASSCAAASCRSGRAPCRSSRRRRSEAARFLCRQGMVGVVHFRQSVVSRTMPKLSLPLLVATAPVRLRRRDAARRRRPACAEHAGAAHRRRRSPGGRAPVAGLVVSRHAGEGRAARRWRGERRGAARVQLRRRARAPSSRRSPRCSTRCAESLRRAPQVQVALLAAPDDAAVTTPLATQRADRMREHLRSRGVAEARLAGPRRLHAASVRSSCA